MVGGCFNALDRLHLAWSELPIYAFAKKIYKTDDRIEWSPELVRHVCQKLALHPIHAQQFRGKSLQLLGALYKAAGLSALMTQDESKTQNGRKRHNPSNETGPRIKSKR
jgi:hypothetical protein